MSLAAPRGADAVARRLAQLLARAPDETPRILRLEGTPAPARVIAVDGSSVTLASSGEHVLAAFRAAAVGLAGGRPVGAEIPQPEVVLLSKADARAAVAERLEASGHPAHGLPRIDPEGALHALRTLEEMRTALEALDTLAPGDMLLLDGALQMRGLVPMLDTVLARAAEREVDVVGVCKSTSISLGGAPALAACQLAAREARIRTWYAPLPAPPTLRGSCYAACLSVAEPRAFRFDLATERAPAELLASIAALCGHPAYPGYPSPLAMAHNAVVIQEDVRLRLRASIRDAAIDAGADPRAWETAFVDYHDVLELGA